MVADFRPRSVTLKLSLTSEKETSPGSQNSPGNNLENKMTSTLLLPRKTFSENWPSVLNFSAFMWRLKEHVFFCCCLMQAVSWMENYTPLERSRGQIIASDAAAAERQFVAAPCKFELLGSIIAHRKTTAFHLLGRNEFLRAQESLSSPLSQS